MEKPVTDELVKRHVEQLRLTGGDLADLCQPLADAIEALTAERDGLLRCVTDNHVALCRAEKAEAERDRLRAALECLLIEYDYAELAQAEPPSLTAAVFSARDALNTGASGDQDAVAGAALDCVCGMGFGPCKDPECKAPILTRKGPSHD